MSHQIYDRESPKEDDVWTTSRFKNEFFVELIKIGKYYEQAKQLIFKIPLTEQNPKSEIEALEFVININDLSPKVQKEFQEYCKVNDKLHVKILLKDVVIMIFENLDYEYAHQRVMKRLRVKMIE